MRRRVRLVVPALAALSIGACGDDDDPAAVRPVVDEIAPAVMALEAELGGPQQYFEINATPQFVNLFVAVEGTTQVRAYLYLDGELQPPAPPGVAAGPTFAAADLTFDEDAVLAGVAEELPGSDIVVFSVIEGPAGAPVYTATVQSGQGGVLDVTVSPEGDTITVDPRTEPDPGATVTTS